MNEPETLELVETDSPAPSPAGALVVTGGSPIDRMMQALDRGLDPDKVEKMLELQERWERREAEKAFNEAMAGFKGEAIEILKRKHVHFETKSGGATDYKHAELSDVVEAVGPALSRHGFSWSWSHKQSAGQIETTCRLKHKLGHFEECSLSGPYDQSGGKNPIQGVISTKTYLERHTLKSICGVAEKGEDNDGQGGPSGGDQAEQPGELDAVRQAGREASMQGMTSLTAWWAGLNAKARGQMQKEFAQMRRVAKEADDARP